MPNSFTTQTQYVVTGNPDTVNQSAAYPDTGQLGQRLEVNTNTYQYVQVDSGANQGTIAAGDLAYWKDRSTFLVTKDIAQSNGGRNNVAGIFRNAMTLGYYGYVLQRGDAISVKSDGSGAEGGIAISDSSNARVTPVTAGTAPTYQPLGKIRGAAAGGFISVDVNIDSAP